MEYVRPTRGSNDVVCTIFQLSDNSSKVLIDDSRLATLLSQKQFLFYAVAFLCGLMCVASHVSAQSDSVAVANDSATQLNTIDTATTALPQTDAPRRATLYKMNYWTAGGLCVLASAGNLYAIPNILHNKKSITDAELESLNTNIYNGIDRVALEQNPAQRTQFKKASDYVLPAAVVSAALLFTDKRVQKDWFKVFTMYFETQAVTFSLYNFSPFGPAFQNRFRPIVYYNTLSHSDRTVGGNRNSFFSGHTANVAASTFFMAKVYSDYHPELGSKRYLLYGLAAIPPVVEGYLRVKALEHFPSDVAAGLFIGAVTGVVVPALHRIRNHNLQLGVTYSHFTGTGMRMLWRPEPPAKKTLKTFVAGT